MKCDQPCQHCGSRAGHARERRARRPRRSSRSPRASSELGLPRGRAHRRRGVPPPRPRTRSSARSRGAGIRVDDADRRPRASRPSGRGRLRDAGLTGLGVSVDGPARVHDLLRGNAGSHEAALRALDAGREVGPRALVQHAGEPPELPTSSARPCAELRAHGDRRRGRCSSPCPWAAPPTDPEWILEPWRVVEVIDTLAAIQREATAARRRRPGRRPLQRLHAATTSATSARTSRSLRSRPGGREAHWRGCRAGDQRDRHRVRRDGEGLPVAAHRAVRRAATCATLARDDLGARASAIRFARDRTDRRALGLLQDLLLRRRLPRPAARGRRTCTLGRRGNNPFCYHRVTQLRKKGIRERLVPVEARAATSPTTTAASSIVEEPWPEG